MCTGLYYMYILCLQYVQGGFNRGRHRAVYTDTQIQYTKVIDRVVSMLMLHRTVSVLSGKTHAEDIILVNLKSN